MEIVLALKIRLSSKFSETSLTQEDVSETFHVFLFGKKCNFLFKNLVMQFKL